MSQDTAPAEGPKVSANQTSPRQMANALRALAMDAVQKAKSGHPGMPMGMADVATVLFCDFLKFTATDPHWPDRDRFVLSAGHGSMLLYGLLHLCGYQDMDMDQLRNFRQLGSRTAGHPEFGHATGIETTTGPLGQGLANAIGMALGEKIMAARFGADLVDHHTYVIVGDGCLMEGISHEAASLAGHLRLGKLIALFDDNQITIDGGTDLSQSEDTLARFTAYGWSVTRVDGHDPDAIRQAISQAREDDKPSLIACRTVIGYGAPNKAGTSAAHGAPLGEEEIAGARKALDWPHGPFEIPEDIVESWRSAGRRGEAEEQAWNERLGSIDGAQGEAIKLALSGDISAQVATIIDDYKKQLAADKPTVATRQASGGTLAQLLPALPMMVGGSADLTGSNNTKTSDSQDITANDFSGNYLNYGVREHAMASIMNGLALHGGIIPYAGTFLVFADYCRPAIRLSALMGQRVVYVFTHDSIGLGEDGPTHQPVEHLASLRAIPGLMVFRPADAVETAESWQCALSTQKAPSVLALTRQGLPTVRLNYDSENLTARGAYELTPADGDAKVTLLASGSEVSLAITARNLLQSGGIPTRVVSMPCWELFDQQEADYRRATLGPGTIKIAVEAAIGQGWERYTGEHGAFVGMTGFGASAPAKDLFKHFSITAEAVAEAARAALKQAAG